MQPLISIIDPAITDARTVLVDARGGADARQRYLASHIPNAIFADLEADLALVPENAAHGGRHPLPPLADFAYLLGRMGITPHTHVIVYDDKAGAMAAARFWWMLRAVGHEKVQVLNGGLQAATGHLQLTHEVPLPSPASTYPVPAAWPGTVDMETAGAAAQDPHKRVVDVRETPRYLGRTEPIDLVAGHIPGAVNIPYLTNLDANGQYLPPATLKVHYEEALGGTPVQDVIVHCGSGVTACHTLLGMAHAGMEGAQLYVGSWSEWSRNDKPIAPIQP